MEVATRGSTVSGSNMSVSSRDSTSVDDFILPAGTTIGRRTLPDTEEITLNDDGEFTSWVQDVSRSTLNQQSRYGFQDNSAVWFLYYTLFWNYQRERVYANIYYTYDKYFRDVNWEYSKPHYSLRYFHIVYMCCVLLAIGGVQNKDISELTSLEIF